ncbi:MAG: NAD-dependent protein deacylase, partial [Candidatus Eisenbacteria bacterium]|nr:NAD-dependent protein deacylase [Candidatus Eisenbacteria bacterium]
AGSTDVLEIHGSLIRARCVTDGDIVEDWRRVEEFPPRCPCGSLLRPDVVWFGETLPPGAIEMAMTWVFESDLVIVAGTSAVVAPASLLPGFARQRGVPIIEINPQETPLSPVATLHLQGRAGELLPRIIGEEGTSERSGGFAE